MRRLAPGLAALAALAVAASPPARASEISDTVFEQLAHDVTVLSVNTPIWLAQHLPATMAQSGLGAGLDLSDDAGSFALGLIPLRVGLFNQFSQAARGTELLQFEEALPGNLPWLQFGLTAGVGLGKGWEIGADVQFIPNTDLGFGEELTVKVGLLSVATSLRWRVNEAHGGVPALVLGVSGSHYRGLMDIGASYSSAYAITQSTTQGNVTVEGTYRFSGAPRMTWELWQVAPEVRLGWKLGPVRPYLGLGLGFSFGHVEGGARLTATATVEKVDGKPVAEPPVVYAEAGDLYDTEPALYLFRPHLGLDLVFGIVAITAQVDLAVMNQSSISTNLGDAADNFNPASEGGLLYNEASKKSQVASALVGTLAMRLQF